MTRSYRFELVKLLSQWRLRLLILACWVVPARAGYRGQPAELAAVGHPVRPLDARHRLGRIAGRARLRRHLVLPLLTSLVAGDVFAAEDRLGTWRHLLVAVRSPRRIFAAKALASLTVILLMMAGLAVSSTAGGSRASATGR